MNSGWSSFISSAGTESDAPAFQFGTPDYPHHVIHGGSIPPCGKPNPWFVEPELPGEDMVPSPDKNSFHASTNPTRTGDETVIPWVDIAPHGVGPQSEAD